MSTYNGGSVNVWNRERDGVWWWKDDDPSNAVFLPKLASPQDAISVLGGTTLLTFDVSRGTEEEYQKKLKGGVS